MTEQEHDRLLGEISAPDEGDFGIGVEEAFGFGTGLYYLRVGIDRGEAYELDAGPFINGAVKIEGMMPGHYIAQSKGVDDFIDRLVKLNKNLLKAPDDYLEQLSFICDIQEMQDEFVLSKRDIDDIHAHESVVMNLVRQFKSRFPGARRSEVPQSMDEGLLRQIDNFLES